MPTKRTRASRSMRSRLTAAAVQAWREGDRIALHRALRLDPWEASPLDEENVYSPNTAYADSWQQSRDWRLELEHAE